MEQSVLEIDSEDDKIVREIGIPQMIGKIPGYANFMKICHRDSGRAITMDEFGIEHASVGARLAQSWLLPEETCMAIALNILGISEEERLFKAEKVDL